MITEVVAARRRSRRKARGEDRPDAHADQSNLSCARKLVILRGGAETTGRRKVLRRRRRRKRKSKRSSMIDLAASAGGGGDGEAWASRVDESAVVACGGVERFAPPCSLAEMEQSRVLQSQVIQLDADKSTTRKRGSAAFSHARVASDMPHRQLVDD